MDNCRKSYVDVAVDEQLFPCLSGLVCIYDKQFIIVLRVILYILIFLRKQLKISRVNLYTNDCFI